MHIKMFMPRCPWAATLLAALLATAVPANAQGWHPRQHASCFAWQGARVFSRKRPCTGSVACALTMGGARGSFAHHAHTMHPGDTLPRPRCGRHTHTRARARLGTPCVLRLLTKGRRAFGGVASGRAVQGRRRFTTRKGRRRLSWPKLRRPRPEPTTHRPSRRRWRFATNGSCATVSDNAAMTPSHTRGQLCPSLLSRVRACVQVPTCGAHTTPPQGWVRAENQTNPQKPTRSVAPPPALAPLRGPAPFCFPPPASHRWNWANWCNRSKRCFAVLNLPPLSPPSSVGTHSS